MFSGDVIENLANWRSVVIDGKYEELKTTALQAKDFKLLKDKLSPIITSDAAKPLESPPPGEKKTTAFFGNLLRKKTGVMKKVTTRDESVLAVNRDSDIRRYVTAMPIGQS